MNKIYFPNLNGLRFFAALLVIIHHLEQIKSIFGAQNYWTNPFVRIIGGLGVILFFVLSGFLITYLLLEEEKHTNTISIKDFYVRRILRIWPLYFLIVIISFFVLSNIPFFDLGKYSDLLSKDLLIKLCLFVFFIPNIALRLFPPVPYASQAWSVGIEEQFYLIWPLLIKNIKRKQAVFYIIIAGYMFMNIFGFQFIKAHIFPHPVMDKVSGIWSTFSIDCMAIGGLFALCLHRKDKILDLLYNDYVQWAITIVLCTLIGFGIKIPYVHHEVYAILFGVAILNLAANPKAIFSFENKGFNYLGKISYGLYMYHPLGIVIALKTLIYFNISTVFMQYALSIGVTVLISWLSYEFFEKYFIKKKIKFSKVLSGDNV